MNADQILELIDRVLPFEVCLYYRVIPLKVCADRIHLGMVEPGDHDALTYLDRLFSHTQHAIIPKAISIDVHQFVMSSYLTQARDRPAASPALDWLKSVDREADREAEAERVIATVDNPDTEPDTNDLQPIEIPPELPHLPASMLVMLPPDRLLPALLAQVLSSGIGRLYFERRETQGSILYSQDGVRQSVLDALPLDLFSETLEQLKQFMELDTVSPLRDAIDPLGSESANPNEGETDREFIYREERVLLRLHVMPGNYGEEATLQVLRGRAMEFYQAQKLEEWGVAAASSAKLLKFLVRKIRTVYLHRPPQPGHNLAFLPQLEHLLGQLEVEMEDLARSSTEDEA